MPPEINACFSCHKDKTLDELQKNLDDWGMNSWRDQEVLSHFLLKKEK